MGLRIFILVLLLILSCGGEVKKDREERVIKGSNLKIEVGKGDTLFNIFMEHSAVNMDTRKVDGNNIRVKVKTRESEAIITAQEGTYNANSKVLVLKRVKGGGEIKFYASSLTGTPEINDTVYLEDCTGFYKGISFSAQKGKVKLRGGKGIFYKVKVEVRK